MVSQVLPRHIEQEMKRSYLDYAMSVLVSRALPDVKDGLKPVHRRILYAMKELNLYHQRPFRKSARIVGDCLGKYHPHGDSAVYEALVRMAQNFSLRYPLVQGQGNFGSIDGDRPAAMRYTEARFSPLAEELIEDLEKEIVPFVSNFDTTMQEPTLLPSKFPNLLVNGSSGIAVGMATNIPPHNLSEAVFALIKQVDEPDISLQEILEIMPGPDFPTGGIIKGTSGLIQAYSTGRGAIRVRGNAEVEESQNRKSIVINEIPFQLRKASLIEEIAQLIKDKKITDVADLRDESDKDGMRIMLDLKQNCNADVTLNTLFTHSRLETTFPIMLVALVDNQPRTVTLKELMQHFINHRIDVIQARARFELRKAEERSHILEGLIIALNNVDAVVALIKKAENGAHAKKALISTYQLSEQQAQAVLDLRLQKFASLETQQIHDEHTSLQQRISELKTLLASEEKIKQVLKEELLLMKEKYGDERRTRMEQQEEEFTTEDLIKPEEMIVTVTYRGYAKRISPEEYRQQKRGGRGILAAATGEEDFVSHLFVANTHSTILFFTNKGTVHWLKVYQLPSSSRQAKGKALVNLLQLQEDERITAILPIPVFSEEVVLLMATKQGVVKKTPLSAYSHPRKGGIRAITLDQNDTLIQVAIASEHEQLMLASQQGNVVHFKVSDVRATGRSSRGVRGIRLRDNDAVVGMVVASEVNTLLTITKNGFGKQTLVDAYRLTRRGGSGVINIQTNERNGQVVAVLGIKEHDEVMFMSKQGIGIRVPSLGISVIGRNTQGYRLMRLDQGDEVVAATIIPPETQ